jgi:DNA repair protein RadD
VILRPYQQAAVQQLRAAYSSGKRAPIAVAPTGSGKTVLAAEVIRLALERKTRCLFLVPRVEILNQSVAKLKDAGITDVRVIQAENDNGSQDAPVVVASIPTLVTPRWLAQPIQAELVVVDECHHGRARTHQQLLALYANSKLLGLSATPQRGDGKALGDVFDSIVTVSSVRELVALGALVPVKVFAPPRILDSRELAQDPVDAYEQRTPGEKAIVFCSSVADAKATCSRFGARARWVSGESRDREATIAAFQRDEFRVLVNVSVCVEGFDDPAISTVIMARRFTYVGSYLQAIGRALRPHPTKQHATVIDLCGSALVHGTPDLPREYALTGKGITDQRASIRQCQQCGGVFEQQPTCPYCAFATPPLTRKQAKALGLELSQVTEQTERRPWFSKIKAKHGGMCKVCFKGIKAGDEIVWAKGKGAKHYACPSSAQQGAAA